MTVTGHDSLGVRETLEVEGDGFDVFSLPRAAEKLGDISTLPFSLKVLLENMLRHEDGATVTTADAQAIVDWQKERRSNHEIAYRPARVLMQDFTGVPAVVDLAAMRDAMLQLGGDPRKINPLSTVDLVIDHSVMIDAFGSPEAIETNVTREFERNRERYEFLRWGQTAFDNFRVVPPGTGICHQVNLEYLSRTVWSEQDQTGKMIAYPDTLVGTDSHTTMVNGLAVLGWGVGGIEAEAAMLGQPISMLIPEVVGMRLTGRLPEGATATDMVLTVTEQLRAHGVVGKFVEYCGPGLDSLTLADRATLANMAPEYGATCGFFPVDAETLRYLLFSGREEAAVKLVEAYAKAQGMWHGPDTPEPQFTDLLELDLATIEPSLAGPKRPQDRVALSNVQPTYIDAETAMIGAPSGPSRAQPVADADYRMEDGHVVIAAVTSCTNTSNPNVMLAAGLLARNAVAKGLVAKPWVKTSLAPGSQVVTDYLAAAGLQEDLDALGFNVVGYGCTTCIGNSGPLPEPVANAVREGDLVVGSVLSGNRNFEGRVHALVKANYLASPPLVVAYALAGTLKIDLATDPLGSDGDGNPVYLKDIWPSNQDIETALAASLTPQMFRARYDDVFTGPPQWQDIKSSGGLTYDWDIGSTYVRHPTFFEDMGPEPGEIQDITGARPLLILSDSVTTDHISPAGAIGRDTPAGEYLIEGQVRPSEFNSYGSRRGNHEVMMRGTFANIRIRNKMAPGTEGGVTRHQPSGDQMSVYDAAQRYADEGVALVVVGGKEYGTGSSRDWAAKGTRLLGVKAVIVESFERIHRSNLIGMGILPLQFTDGDTGDTLGLVGTELFDLIGLSGDGLQPRKEIECAVTSADGTRREIPLLCRIDTADELEYYRHGGILQYVLRNLAS